MRKVEFRVVCHYPKKKEDMEELEKKVAEVHTEAVIGYMKRKDIPKEVLDRLLEEM